MAVLALVLDVVVVCLLVATIVYAVLLNRQIVRLRDSRGELQVLIKGFNEATGRAEAGVKGMKRVAGEAGEGLQKAIERAQSLRDELQLIIDTGEALANRLEGSASERTRGPAPASGGRGGLPARRSAMEPVPTEAGPRRPRPTSGDDGDGRRPAPGKAGSDELDGLSRAERDLLKAIEGRR